MSKEKSTKLYFCQCIHKDNALTNITLHNCFQYILPGASYNRTLYTVHYLLLSLGILIIQKVSQLFFNSFHIICRKAFTFHHALNLQSTLEIHAYMLSQISLFHQGQQISGFILMHCLPRHCCNPTSKQT